MKIACPSWKIICWAPDIGQQVLRSCRDVVLILEMRAIVELMFLILAILLALTLIPLRDRLSIYNEQLLARLPLEWSACVPHRQPLLSQPHHQLHLHHYSEPPWMEPGASNFLTARGLNQISI